jgi:hypothetical protein
MKTNIIFYPVIFILFLFLISFTASVAAAQTAYITCDDGNVYLINTDNQQVAPLHPGLPPAHNEVGRFTLSHGTAVLVF